MRLGKPLFLGVFTLGLAGSALAAPKVGEKVLAMREGTNSFFAATVKSAVTEDGNTSGSVTFADGTTQEYGPLTFEPSLRPFSWAAGSAIECGPDAATAVEAGDADSPKLTRGTIASIDATSVELSSDGKKQKFPLAGCRYHRTWFDELNERWRNYGKYAQSKGLPKHTPGTVSGEDIAKAYSFALESADGGAYIVLKKCVVTGKGWSKVSSGSELTARTVDAACLTAVPLPPKPKENFTCLVEFGQCRQPHQGNNVFGACEWKYAAAPPEQIKCPSGK